MAKRKQDSGGDIPEWVVTYGDLMSLLLCFFILLAAFSELKKEDEYLKVLESIQEALGFRGGLGIADLDYPVMNNMTNRQNDRANYSDERLDADDNTDRNVVGRNNRTSVVHEGSMLAIGGSIPFEPAEYALTPSAMDTVRDEIAPKISGQNYVVYVIGHAWGEQEELSGFSSGELAFRRADAVAQFLVRECGVDPLILRVMSAGAQEPATLASSDVESSSPNRRVQVWQTGRTVDQTHPDPNYTSAGAP